MTVEPAGAPDAPAESWVDDPESPILERVPVNRFTLVLGLVAALIFGFVGWLLTGLAGVIHSPRPAFGWPLLALALLVVAAALRQLLWPVPLLEATSRGVRLRIASPMSRSGMFFIPWSGIRAIICTRTVVAGRGGGREDAIGLVVAAEECHRLPKLKWNAGLVAPEAARCDVALPTSMIRGSAAEWAQRLEQHRVQERPLS